MNVGKSVFKAIADFSAVRREAKKTQRSLTGMANEVGNTGSRGGRAFTQGFVRAMAGLSTILPLLGSVGALAIAAVGNLVLLANSLLSVAGAALALPGILGGVAVGAGVLIAVLKDFTDVLPDVVQQFSALQDELSNQYWSIAAAPIREMVNTLMPGLTRGLGGIARAWGDVTAQSAKTFSVMMMVNGNMDRMLSNTEEGLRASNEGVQAFIKGIVTLGAVGSDYLPALGRWFTELGLKFNAFVQVNNANGSIKQWIDDGIVGLQDLGRILVHIVAIFAALDKAATAAGLTSSLHGLALALGEIAARMNADGFQTAMSTIFAGAEAGAQGLLAALGPIGVAFDVGAKAFAEFLRLGGEIVGLLLGGLATALSNPAFGGPLVAFLESAKLGVEAMLPLLPGLTAAFGGILDKLAPLIEILGPALVSTFTILANAVVVFLTVFEPLLEMIANSPTLLAILIGSFVAVAGAAALLTAAANIMHVALLAYDTVTKIATAATWLFKTALGKGAAGMKLYAAAQAVATGAVRLFSAALAANPVGFIITLIVGLIAALVWFFTETEVGRAIVAAAWEGIKVAAAAVADWFTNTAVPALVGAWEAIKSAWGEVTGFFSNLWAGVVAVFQWTVGIITGVFTAIQTGVQLFVTGFMAVWTALVAFFQPVISLVVAILQMFGAIFGFVFALARSAMDLFIVGAQMVWEQIVSIFQAIGDFIAMVVGAIVSTLTTAWQAILDFIVPILQAIWSTVTDVWNRIVEVITTVLTAIWTVVSDVWNRVVGFIGAVLSAIWAVITDVWNRVYGFVSGILQRVWSIVSSVWNQLVSAVSGPLSSIWSAVSGTFTRVVDFIRAIPGRILNALGNLGSLLWNAGVSIVNGLLDGLKAMVGNVTDFFRNLTAQIPDWKGPLPTDKTLLTGAGRAIMNGFLGALESMYDPVRNSLAGFTSSLDAEAELPLNFRPGDDPFDPGAALMSGWDRAFQTELAPELNARTVVNESPGDTYHVDKLEVNNPAPEPASDSLPNTIRALSGVGVRKS